MEATTETTGQKLAEKLAERGISKHGLARESQVSYRTVCRVVSGDRVGTLDTWMRIAAALDCNLDDIIR